MFLGIRDNLDRFFGKGPQVIMGRIYREWIDKKGYSYTLAEDEVEFMGQKMTVKNNKIIPKLEDLALDEQEEWQNFLMIGEVNRQLAVEITQRLIGLIDIPDIRYISDPSLESICSDLARARKKIVVQIFPDLTDEEAKTFFGQLVTAKEVSKSAYS